MAATAAFAPLLFPHLLFLWPAQPTSLIKIKHRKEMITGDKPFIGANVATPGHSTGECCLADSKKWAQQLFT
jgi:hypothetical protein